MHWASTLIGRPWSNDFNCWDLVRLVFAQRYGIEMPMVSLVTDDNVRAIKQAAEVSGWRRVESEPQDGDIAMMVGLRGRHVGVLIEVDGKVLLLHNNGHATPRGPTGGVVAQPLAEATRDGYHNFELWRHQP